MTFYCVFKTYHPDYHMDHRADRQVSPSVLCVFFCTFTDYGRLHTQFDLDLALLNWIPSQHVQGQVSKISLNGVYVFGAHRRILKRF